MSDQTVNQHIEGLAEAIVFADSTDLPALAQIHEHLEQVVASASAVDPDLSSVLTEAAGAAGKIVEQIILEETDDTAAALAGRVSGERV